MRMSELKKNIHFTGILKPLIYMLLFSALYCIAYLAASSVIETSWLWETFLGLLVGAFSVCCYFVCTLLWGRKRGTLSLKKTGLVFAWGLLWYGIIAYGLYNVYVFAVLYGWTWLTALCQIVSIGLLVLIAPWSLLLFRQLYQGQPALKRILTDILMQTQKNWKRIFYPWIVVVFIQILWDSLFGGPLTALTGNFLSVLYNWIVIGNPLFYPILILSFLSQGASEAYVYLTLLSLLQGTFMVWLELNMVFWITKTKPGPAEKRK